MLHRKDGFSLLELMVALAVVAVLAFVAVPSLNRWRWDLNLTGSHSDLSSDLELAKNRAIKDNRPVVVQFTSSGYRIFLDTDNDWNEDSLVKEVSLSGGVRLDLSATDLSDDRTRFNNRGIPENRGSIILLGSGDGARRITLSQLGRFTHNQSDDGGVTWE